MLTNHYAKLREQLDQVSPLVESEAGRKQSNAMVAPPVGSLESSGMAESPLDDMARVEFRLKDVATTDNLYRNMTIEDCEKNGLIPDLLMEQYAELATTPPRTRIKIKNRDWERKQRGMMGNSNASAIDAMPGVTRKGSNRLARLRAQSRNTMDCALLNEMFVNEESKRTDKRLQSLLRNTDHELITSSVNGFHERAADAETLSNCLPAGTNIAGPVCIASKIVESCNRYRCVSSKPCRASAPPGALTQPADLTTPTTRSLTRSRKLPDAEVCVNKRKEFHETFANLIKLGSVDRQDAKPTQEEYIWQTELKDLIWLELQAWQADRSVDQQDRYVVEARQAVPGLLLQIINYKFQPKFRRQSSQVSNDSSAFSYTESIQSSSVNDATPQSLNEEPCHGCMSLYCDDCNAQQQVALKEVEELLTRLEAAEALYPSTQAMGALHPIYKSEDFVGRIKAMCLWYNISRQNQMKLAMLGKIFSRLHCEHFTWPVQTSYVASDSGNSSISGYEADDSTINSVDAREACVLASTPKVAPFPKVHFLINDAEMAPGDATSSNDSNSTDYSLQPPDFSDLGLRRNSMQDLNIFSVEPLGAFGNISNGEQSSALYRKFIEHVLKSRGLAKSLEFLHRMYIVVLQKAHISLEKPDSEDYDLETETEALEGEDLPCLDSDISPEQVVELRRYGYWSPEAQSLNLPSYIPTFVFLSGMPLQFMHEFLRMRLETRPVKPNPLSLEQLLKELREGLTLALMHRERYQRHVTTALAENKEELEQYMGILVRYDATVFKAFKLYLSYVDQLVTADISVVKQKCTLEKEWMFTKLMCPMIKGMHTLACERFCEIISKLLRNISERLIKRSQELRLQINETRTEKYEADLKWQLLTICRETQALFTDERESSIKVIFFAKTFCRDVENADFHREHYGYEQVSDYICNEVKHYFKTLQQDVLDVRDKITLVLRHVQYRCCEKNLLNLDEGERQAIASRTREIMHQGYKFGFEYHKDVIRLFEQRIMDQNDSTHKIALGLGIIEFAKMWMENVTECCERGRGVRPRWASQGLEFLMLACDPQNTQHLSDVQFEELKHQMDRCISHVIGLTSEPERIARKKSSPRARKASSPVPSRSRTPSRTSGSSSPLQSPQCNKLLHPQFSVKEETPNESPSIDAPDFVLNSINQDCSMSLRLSVPETPPKAKTGLDFSPLATRTQRVRDAVNRLDMEIEHKLRDDKLIGQIKELNGQQKAEIRSRSVQFRWHRGILIAKGSFGKVYTAVNNSNGELMAMKEIAISPGETQELRKVAEEIRILEGVKHKNLVRYYGIEIHREELLIFMELCSQGTLEALVALSGALPEGLTRRFSSQLLAGVAELHKHGIVHRDIKTANIFLVDGSNSLKLGDFGSAVKIQTHATMPGELCNVVGTQAYMAPEVFLQNRSDGHGRAADIWSVGCVVIEMASGERPWSQYSQGYQILFKVGKGERPEIPSSLSQEGHDFIDCCLQFQPSMRKTASELLEHDFCKYGDDEDCCIEGSQAAPPSISRSIRRILRRS